MEDTTREDSPGEGYPRLIMALGGLAPEGAGPQEFRLRLGTTTVGSAPDSDLRLSGLDAQHAEIRHHADGDEYVWVDQSFLHI